MSKKQARQTKALTTLKISVGINIALSLIIISTLSATLWAYCQYRGGTERAAGFSLLHMDDFCTMRDKNLDKWEQNFKNQLTEDRGVLSAKELEDSKETWKRDQLSINMVCNTYDYEPYQVKAAEEYFKANGFELFPKDTNIQ